MIAEIMVYRTLDPDDLGEVVSPACPVRVQILDDADHSDPLNQLIVLSTKAGRFSTRVTLVRDPKWPVTKKLLEEAMSATLAVYVDLAAEVRDSLKEPE